MLKLHKLSKLWVSFLNWGRHLFVFTQKKGNDYSFLADCAGLVIGLGNPGETYAKTRHNIGFEIIDALIDKTNATLKVNHAEYQIWEAHIKTVGDALTDEIQIALLKPLRYMNLSGEVVADLQEYHTFTLDSMMVIVDDIHIKVGKIRIRRSGSAGGHNGTQNIIDELESNKFPRMRIGVGSDFDSGSQIKFVLDPFPEEDRPAVDAVTARAVDAIISFYTAGIDKTMGKFNG